MNETEKMATMTAIKTAKKKAVGIFLKIIGPGISVLCGIIYFYKKLYLESFDPMIQIITAVIAAVIFSLGVFLYFTGRSLSKT